MFCPRCSKEIDDDSRFCPNCGLEIVPAANSVKDKAREEDDILARPITSHSMLECGYELKWYKALIYVLIWLQVLAQVVDVFALQTALGGRTVWYGIDFRPVFIFIAVYTALYAVFLVVVRQSLAHWKTYGPLLFYLSIFSSPVFLLLLKIVAALTIDGVSFTIGGNDISAFAFPVVYFILNRIYFKNRAELFTE